MVSAHDRRNAAKAAAFMAMHAGRGFVLPNAWDAGSARILERAGFPATYFAATTSDPFAETVERAVRYVEAGADCVFVPGVVEADTIRRLAATIPGPLNVVAGLANTIDAPTLFSLGVTRVSLGGSLARAALSTLERAGRELLDSGTMGFLDGALSYAALQRRFSS